MKDLRVLGLVVMPNLRNLGLAAMPILRQLGLGAMPDSTAFQIKNIKENTS
jgi:hypothetical protein